MKINLEQTLQKNLELQKSGWVKWGNRFFSLVNILCFLFITVTSIWILPSFSKMFQEVGLSIPALTKIILKTPTFCYFMVTTIGIFTVLIKEVWLPKLEDRLAINGFLFLSLVLFHALVTVAMFLPLL